MISGHRLYFAAGGDALTIAEIKEIDDKFGLADSAAIAGDKETLALVMPLLSDAERSFIAFRHAQITNDLVAATNHLRDCVESSRRSDVRNHALEARARMEWGLLRFTQGEKVEAGSDLKWAMERFKVLDEGSRDHGLSILNMAAWHIEAGEKIMALAQLAQIDREGPHEPEIIALSRYRLGELYFQLGDYSSAQRHCWVGFNGLLDAGINDLAVEAGLRWLDISLTNVSEEGRRMSTVVSEVTPRDLGQKGEIVTHPGDIEYALSILFDQLGDDYSGEVRTDLCLLIEAEMSIGGTAIRDEINRTGMVDDEELASLLSRQIG